MEDLLREIHFRARDKYESSLKWSFAIFSLAVLMYATLVEEYGSVNTSLAQTVAKRETVGSAHAGLKIAYDAFSAFQKDMASAASGLTGDAFERIRGDFKDLDAAVAAAMGGTSSGGRIVKPTRRERRGAMVAQMGSNMPFPGMQAQAARPTMEIDPKTLSRLKRAKDHLDYLTALQPIVEAEIMTPRFAALDDEWKRRSAAALKRLDEAMAKATENRPALEAEKVWGEIERRRDELKTFVAGFAFEKPEATLWWRSVGGKGRRFDTMEYSLSSGVHDSVELEGFAALVVKMNAADAELDGRLKDLDARAAALEKDFVEKQEELGALGLNLGSFGIELEDFVRHYAIVVALVTAVALLWPAYTRLRLGRLDVSLLERYPDVPREKTFLPGIAVAHERWTLPLAAWVIAGAALSGLALWRVAGWGLLEGSAVYTDGALAVAVLAAAAVARVVMTVQTKGLAGTGAGS